MPEFLLLKRNWCFKQSWKKDYVIKYYDRKVTHRKARNDITIPEGVTVKTVIDKYIEAIGGKVMAVK